MAYVIHGATGAQGAPIYRRLANSGKEVRAAGRGINLGEGVNAVSADFASAVSLINAYRDADGIFIHLPLGSEEQRLRFADNIITAVQHAKPKRVIVSTSGYIVDAQNSNRLIDKTKKPSAIAHLINNLESAHPSVAIIAPRFFLENLLLPIIYEPAISEGILRYPLPETFPSSWCSHLDIAEVAARLFDNNSITGTVGVGHLPGLDGNALAHGFSDFLKKPVSYEPLDPAVFKNMLTPLYGSEAATEVADSYANYARVGSNVIRQETSAQSLLDLKPRTIESWLSEIIK